MPGPMMDRKTAGPDATKKNRMETVTGPFPILIITLLALALGSFLNVVIHRMPKGEDFVRERSRCPRCGRRVRFFDNVPLISYAVLGGRCRDCKAPISTRYPLVEGLTAFLVLAVLSVYGFGVPFIAYSVLCLFLIPISFIDWDTGFIPDRLVLPASIMGIIFLIVFHFVNWKVTWLSGLIGALAGGGLILFFMVVGKAILKKDAMGMGDLKMLVMIGLYVGFPAVWLSLFFGGLAASLFILVSIVLKRITWKSAIPFGPFIAIGTVTYVLAGDTLIRWYLGFFR
jgi:leader peptidase (prepilin peptidase) / N-methyltransferase